MEFFQVAIITFYMDEENNSHLNTTMHSNPGACFFIRKTLQSIEQKWNFVIEGNSYTLFIYSLYAGNTTWKQKMPPFPAGEPWDAQGLHKHCKQQAAFDKNKVGGGVMKRQIWHFSLKQITAGKHPSAKQTTLRYLYNQCISYQNCLQALCSS